MKKCSPEKLAILSYDTFELNERNVLVMVKYLNNVSLQTANAPQKNNYALVSKFSGIASLKISYGIKCTAFFLCIQAS